jgi:hypothetical protein
MPTGVYDHWKIRGRPCRPFTEEHKKRMGHSVTGSRNPMYGKHQSVKSNEINRMKKLGEKNPMWLGGRIQLNSLELELLYKWSNEVKERDNWTCQYCGSHTNLQAHHILSVVQYPERIFDVGNGITLCYDCHRRNSNLVRGLELATAIQIYL